MRAPALVTLALGAAASCSGPPPPPRAAPRPVVARAPAPAATAPLLGTTAVRYVMTTDPAVEVLRAEVCFEGAPTARLDPQIEEARDRLVSAARVRGGREEPLAPDAQGLALDALAAGDCVRYAIDLRARGGALAAFGDETLSPDVWLWTAVPRPDAAEVTARFELPDGVRVAVPWPRAGEGYRVPPSAFLWQGQGAIGRFGEEIAAVPGGRLRLVTLGAGFGADAPEVRAWIERAAATVAPLYGGLPVPEAQVLLVPVRGRGRSFGYVMRGGGPSVLMRVGRDVGARALAADWTAVHELIHFGIPQLPVEDAWLYEGLAQYYTAVLRARAGAITPAEAWAELLDGFARGKRAGTGRTLRDESAAMHTTGAYWRVYWAGAALALRADVELRARAEGAPGLDEGVRDLRAWCGFDAPEVGAGDVMERIESRAGAPVLSRLAAEHLDREAFPETAAMLERLGVRLRAGGTAQLDARAPWADVRRAIMGEQ